jgi:hypothetical protein
MEGWSSKRCALTWRLWGTKYGRVSFQLRVLALPTDVIASGLLLKTPCAADAYTEGLSKKEQRFGNSGTLAQEVQSGFIYQRGLLPTPTATSDPKGGCTRPDPSRQRDTLAHALHDPTLGKTSQLNPRFVAEMMGFPVNWTELPFQSGELKASKPTETR